MIAADGRERVDIATLIRTGAIAATEAAARATAAWTTTATTKARLGLWL
jgi:hypothetical protein